MPSDVKRSRVAVVSIDVCLYPVDRFKDIVDDLPHGNAGRESIVDMGRGEAFFEKGASGKVVGSLVQRPPESAVNEDEDGRSGLVGGNDVDGLKRIRPIGEIAIVMEIPPDFFAERVIPIKVLLKVGVPFAELEIRVVGC